MAGGLDSCDRTVPFDYDLVQYRQGAVGARHDPATTQASTSQTITVEHIRISSELSFAEVRRKLEGTVPKLDIGIAEALHSGDQKRAKDYEENGPKLSMFGEHPPWAC
jgi:hypothetical protein